MKVYLIDPDAIRDIKKDLKNVLLNIKKESKKVNQKYSKKVKYDLNKIAVNCINKYYDYPTSYKRKWDLYNTYRIKATVDEWSIEFDSNDMQDHGRLNNYIFDWMFIQGYHGGAISGEGHPDPGTPWLRKGVNGKFTDWYKPASQTISPYDLISEAASKYLDKTQQDAQKEFETPILEELSVIENKILSLL